MESNTVTDLRDSTIVKAMLQMDILNMRCKLTPETSSDTIPADKIGRECPCVYSELKTEICQRLSKTKLETQNLWEYIENILPFSSLDIPSTSSPTMERSSTESEMASNDSQIKTDDAKALATTEPSEPNVIAVNNAVNIAVNNAVNVKVETDSTFDKFLEKHINFFGCAWSKCPHLDLICIREKDNTVHICDVIKNTKTVQVGLTPYYVQKEGTKLLCKSITCIDWNPYGTESLSQLVTGTYDGFAQVWSTDGKKVKCLKTLEQHKGPVLALKWNKKGNYILSAGIDSTAIIWDASAGKVVKQFKFHTEPILGIDWNTKRSFASCGIDRTIYVCRLGCDQPVQTFDGHKDIVYDVKWDPQGQRLVSYSKDKTMKIWSLKQKAYIHNLWGHSSKINAAIWSPTGPGSDNPNKKLILASASADSTVRLWDIDRGACVKTLRKHTAPVTCLDFSPDGRLLVSGGLDKYIHIWSTQIEDVICSFQAPEKIAQVHWNPRQDVIAGMAQDGGVFLLDLRRPS